MTIKARVTFTLEHEVIVEGETLEEIQDAAKAQALSGDFRDWDGDWDWNVIELNTKNRSWLSQEKLDAIMPECGIIDGKILAHSDYEKEKQK